LDHVRAKDRYELSLAVGIHALSRCRAAIGARRSPASIVDWHAKQSILRSQAAEVCEQNTPRAACRNRPISIVTQRDCLDKPSFGLSLDAAQPWVLTLPLESDVPTARVQQHASTAAGRLHPAQIGRG
jgi:hypothetical protein